MRYPFLAPLVAIAILLFCSTSCIDKYADEQLTIAEGIMETRPDSAYAILSQIDKSRLKGKPKQARYALLMSAAMDKNLIDTTTFDVLQPAIEYFLKRGTPDEKLKTYYYRGRIFQNTGDRDNALASFVRGSDISDLCSDSMAIARNFVARAILYMDFYDIESSTNDYLKAANIYKSLSKKDLEFDCLLSAINGFNLLNNDEKADSLIRLCENFEITDDGQLHRLQRHKLINALNSDSIQNVRNILDSNVLNQVSDVNDIFDLALAYNKINDNNTALQMLDFINESNMSYDTLRYQAVFVYVLEGLENYKDAFSVYKQFSHRLDSINQQKFDQKSKQIEERHELELKAEKDAKAKSRIIEGSIGCAILFTLVIMLLLLMVRKNKIQKELAIQRAKTSELENNRLKTDMDLAIKEATITNLENEKLKSEEEKLTLEKNQLTLANRNLQLQRDKKALEAENLAHRVETLENESDRLKDLINAQKELPEEVRSVIKVRLEMLNSLLAGYITANSQYEKPYEMWVKKLADNTLEFMNTNRLAFQASHPQFIRYFEEHNLTTDEINYVCLYAIGLRGKEVGNYMKKRSHVNISSAIRKKLGIDKYETNIGIYVRKLLKSL